MIDYDLTAVMTLTAVLATVGMGIKVAQTRRKTGIAAPAMMGDPLLERTIRAHLNTVEWLPMFIPVMWIAALVFGDVFASSFGCLWIFGRIIYFRAYVVDAKKREPGFIVQTLAVAVMLFGSLGKILWDAFF